MRDLSWLEWPLIWLAVALGAVGVAWAIAWGITISERTALEHGYDIVRRVDTRDHYLPYDDYVKSKIQTAPERIER